MTSENLLLKKPVYKITETATGTCKEFLYENGHSYREFISHQTILGVPLISIVNGKCPETGKHGVARGVVAIGQRAKGVLAIGQFADGYVSVGQFAAARLVGVGQFTIAPIGIGQFSLALLGIGQFGVSGTGIFQIGYTMFGGIGQHITNISELLSRLF